MRRRGKWGVELPSVKAVLEREFQLFMEGERAAMSEFKLKRTTKEWILNRDFATDHDYSVSKLDVEGRFVVRGGPRFAESQADPMGSAGGIEFTHAQFEALVRLWERELRPAGPVSESADKIPHLCLKNIDATCKPNHVCLWGEQHRDRHQCGKCGFEWE